MCGVKLNLDLDLLLDLANTGTAKIVLQMIDSVNLCTTNKSSFKFTKVSELITFVQIFFKIITNQTNQLNCTITLDVTPRQCINEWDDDVPSQVD